MTSTSIAPQEQPQDAADELAVYERRLARQRWVEAHKRVNWHFTMHGVNGDSAIACDLCVKLLNDEADLWDAYQGSDFTPPPFRLEWDQP